MVTVLLWALRVSQNLYQENIQHKKCELCIGELKNRKNKTKTKNNKTLLPAPLPPPPPSWEQKRRQLAGAEGCKVSSKWWLNHCEGVQLPTELEDRVCGTVWLSRCKTIFWIPMSNKRYFLKKYPKWLIGQTHTKLFLPKIQMSLNVLGFTWDSTGWRLTWE